MLKLLRRLLGIPKLKNIEELRRYIKPGDVNGLANWIEWRIPYAYDRLPGDDWKSANKSIEDGGGDCEDKAVVAWEVISTWIGWDARLFIMTRPNPAKGEKGIDAHAVCGATNLLTGERYAVEGTRPYAYPNRAAWGWIFADIGHWERHWEVNSKGEIL